MFVVKRNRNVAGRNTMPDLEDKRIWQAIRNIHIKARKSFTYRKTTLYEPLHALKWCISTQVTFSKKYTVRRTEQPSIRSISAELTTRDWWTDLRRAAKRRREGRDTPWSEMFKENIQCCVMYLTAVRRGLQYLEVVSFMRFCCICDSTIECRF